MSILLGSDTFICYCGCPRCVAGSCCMDSTTGQPPIRWTTNTNTIVSSGAIVCGALDHDFAALDPSRLFCRKCGTTRKVE